MRRGSASGPAGDSLPATITPSHTAMRCFRRPTVGRCGGAADDGHTITRTATITHGLALLAFGIWGGLQPKKLGGGGEITEEECPSDFSAISCFYSTLKSWSCWLLVFCAFDDVCA